MSLRYCFSAALALLVTAAAVAQDPDPKEILTKADAATKALKAVSYRVEAFGQDGETRREMGKAAVKLRIDGEKSETSRAAMRIEGSARGQGGEVSIDWTGDGKELLIIDKERKLAKRLPYEKMSELDRGLQQLRDTLVMLEFNHPNPFGDEINGKDQTYEGKKTINGVECHVILVKYAMNDLEARWFFGVKDNLPRRVERLTQRYVVELADLVAEPKLADDTFAIKAPAGFEEDAPGILAAGRNAPAFSLATADGKNVSLAELKDKTIVLAFWSSWNGPAKKALPIVQKLHETHAAGGKVAVFGVQVWEDTDPTKFLKENNYTFPTLVKGDKVAESFKIEKLPAFFVIGTDGKIKFSAVGIDGDREAEITKAIAAASK